ncbi:MAG: methyltransferase domain-containing protein [Sedimentisphaerales bacterium]|nr:methyltransferase domain-containing protein [Sedimentisphaerales bacterium]
MIKPENRKTRYPHNRLYYGMGLLFLLLNKIRNKFQGYSSPRTFPMSDFQRAIHYDMQVINHWRRILCEYVGRKYPFQDKTILELGPGADLGIGILCLARGARHYHGLDVNNLVQSVPGRFYEELFYYMKNTVQTPQVDIDYLREQINLTRKGQNDKINYICSPEFDLTLFQDKHIDLVFSQAAFEHFDNVEHTLSRLSEITAAGAILIAEVDLATHTRWIRDWDPLNIYRYSDSIYDTLKFSGSPNRLRPREYREILQETGWENIKIYPLTRVNNHYIKKINQSLPRQFRNPENQMDYLSIALCATRG